MKLDPARYSNMIEAVCLDYQGLCRRAGVCPEDLYGWAAESLMRAASAEVTEHPDSLAMAAIRHGCLDGLRALGGVKGSYRKRNAYTHVSYSPDYHPGVESQEDEWIKRMDYERILRRASRPRDSYQLHRVLCGDERQALGPKRRTVGENVKRACKDFARGRRRIGERRAPIRIAHFEAGRWVLPSGLTVASWV